MADATVNCPYEDCDFPLDLTGLEDDDIVECPDCGRDVQVMNDGTKLIKIEEEDEEY